MIQQYLRLGLMGPLQYSPPRKAGEKQKPSFAKVSVIEEPEIALALAISGGWRRLFGDVPDSVPRYQIAEAIDGPMVTHLRYERAE